MLECGDVADEREAHLSSPHVVGSARRGPSGRYEIEGLKMSGVRLGAQPAAGLDSSPSASEADALQEGLEAGFPPEGIEDRLDLQEP